MCRVACFSMMRLNARNAARGSRKKIDILLLLGGNNEKSQD
jgi:hypothetical protein